MTRAASGAIFQRPVVPLCLFIFGCTFSVGAFPVLLPEIGRDAAISDFALGAIAGAFGLARVLADIPAGLFITHHLRRALVLAALALAAGVLCLASGGPLPVLIAGRALWGVGHALAMLAGITAIVRHARPGEQGTSLNAFEMSAMLGVLCGMVVTGLLPRHWPWNLTLVVAASPQLLSMALVPALLASLPRETTPASARPLFSRGHVPVDAGPRQRMSRLTLLAFAAGCTIALAWSAVGQFLLPLRASREFELDRMGVALLIALPQVVDVVFLLPMGRLADRVERRRLLGLVLLLFAFGVVAVAYGSLPLVIAGCVVFGVGMAAWMLPVTLVNRDAPAGSVAWRTALYRVAVDAGVFLGPVLSGLLLDAGLLWVLGLTVALALLAIGAALWRR